MKFMSRKQIVSELRKKTGFYKADIETLLEALNDVIVEQMKTATIDHPSEIRLFAGWKIGAKVVPPHIISNSVVGKNLEVPERLRPYCSFQEAFKYKLNGDTDE